MVFLELWKKTWIDWDNIKLCTGGKEKRMKKQLTSCEDNTSMWFRKNKSQENTKSNNALTFSPIHLMAIEMPTTIPSPKESYL